MSLEDVWDRRFGGWQAARRRDADNGSEYVNHEVARLSSSSTMDVDALTLGVQAHSASCAATAPVAAPGTGRAGGKKHRRLAFDSERASGDGMGGYAIDWGPDYRICLANAGDARVMLRHSCSSFCRQSTLQRAAACRLKPSVSAHGSRARTGFRLQCCDVAAPP